MPAPQLPTPPGTQSNDVANAVPDVNRTTKERVMGGVGELLNVGSDDDFASTPLGQTLSRHHDVRLANARRHYDSATTLAAALAQGDVDPQTGEPTGIDPSTQKAMTPEQRQQFKDQLEGAWGDYQKIAGVSPEAKQTLEKHKGILDFAITKGHEALQKVIGAHQQASQAAGQSGAPPTPPPSATGMPNAGTGAPPAQPGLPPPPTTNPQPASGATAAPQAPVAAPPAPHSASSGAPSTPGNIDLYKQPKVKNPDGSISTVDSRSYNFDGKEVLLPSVTPDGRHLKTDDEIIAEYKKTGRHLGMFDDVASANAYAEQLHNDYAAGKYDRPNGRLASPPRAGTAPMNELAMPAMREDLAAYRKAKQEGFLETQKVLGTSRGELQAYAEWKKANPNSSVGEYLQQRGKMLPASYVRQQIMEKGVLGSDYPSIPTLTGEPADPKMRYDVVNDPMRGRYLIPSGIATEAAQAGIENKTSSTELNKTRNAAIPEQLDIQRQRLKLSNQQYDIALKRYGLSRLQVGANYDPALLTPEEQQQMDLPVDSAGRPLPLKSPNAPTAATRNTAQTAQVVDGLVGSTLDLLKNPKVQKELGPISGRLNEIYIGTIGASELGISDPDTAAAITALRTLGSFDASGALKVHFGARGGGAQYDKFKNLMDTGKMDAPTLIASLGALHRVLGPEGYSGEVKTTRGTAPPAAKPNAKAPPPKARPTNAKEYLDSIGVPSNGR